MILTPGARRILAHLQRKGSITAAEAEEMYGVHRLAARIADLRSIGYVIATDRERGKNRYGEEVWWAVYSLISEPEMHEERDEE